MIFFFFSACPFITRTFEVEKIDFSREEKKTALCYTKKQPLGSEQNNKKNKIFKFLYAFFFFVFHFSYYRFFFFFLFIFSVELCQRKRLEKNVLFLARPEHPSCPIFLYRCLYKCIVYMYKDREMKRKMIHPPLLWF